VTNSARPDNQHKRDHDAPHGIALPPRHGTGGLGIDLELGRLPFVQKGFLDLQFALIGARLFGCKIDESRAPYHHVIERIQAARA